MYPNFSDEILRLICSFSDDVARVALAQTNKQVSHAAVKVHWANIDRLERLRHPMPLDAYTILWNGRNIVIVRAVTLGTPSTMLTATYHSPSRVT